MNHLLDALDLGDITPISDNINIPVYLQSKYVGILKKTEFKYTLTVGGDEETISRESRILKTSR